MLPTVSCQRRNVQPPPTDGGLSVVLGWDRCQTLCPCSHGAESTNANAGEIVQQYLLVATNERPRKVCGSNQPDSPKDGVVQWLKKLPCRDLVVLAGGDAQSGVTLGDWMPG